MESQSNSAKRAGDGRPWRVDEGRWTVVDGKSILPMAGNYRMEVGGEMLWGAFVEDRGKVVKVWLNMKREHIQSNVECNTCDRARVISLNERGQEWGLKSGWRKNAMECTVASSSSVTRIVLF